MKRKLLHNIYRCRHYSLFVLFIVLLNNTAVAQYAEDTVTIKEEVVDEEEPDEEEEKEKTLFRYKDENNPYNVNQRNLPPGYAKKLKEDDDFWYADAAPETKKSKTSIPVGSKGSEETEETKKILEQEQRIDTSIGSDYEKNQQNKNKEPEYKPVNSKSSGLETILWIIIIAGFAGILAWYLFTNNIRLRKNKKIKPEADTDEMPEDIFAINYLSEVDKAVAQGNYRLAIRLQYLRMLKAMAERNIIHYKQDKTNLDYMMELQPTVYYNNFFRTTRHYEFAWYGKFPVSPETYAAVRHGFDGFEKQITGN